MRLRTPAGVAVAALVSLLLGACTGDPGEERPDEPEKPDLVVGTLAIPETAPLDLAIRHGLFQAEGLTVTRTTIEGTTQALPDLHREVTDVIYGDYVAVMQAYNSGTADVRIVADMAHASAGEFQLVVPEGSKIKSVGDLKDKTIAVDRFKSTSTLGVEKALEEHGLSARDVRFRQVRASAIPAVLTGGRADAAFLSEPRVTAFQDAGGERIDADPLKGLPTAGWVAEESWVGRYPNTVAAFQRALRRAQRLAYEKKNEIVAGYGDIALPTYRSRVEWVPLQDLADLMRRLKYTRGRLDASELMPPSQPMR